MIRLLWLRYRRRQHAYALQRVREMRADCVASEQYYLERLRELDAEIAVERMNERFKVRS